MYAKGITDKVDKLLGGFNVMPTMLKPTKDQEKAAEEILVAVHNNIAGMGIREIKFPNQASRLSLYIKGMNKMVSTALDYC